MEEALEVCRYLVARVKAAAGPRWRQGRRAVPFACAVDAEEARLVAERRLCGVPEPAARALLGWVAGQRPALRLHHAPSPREVLAHMARGRRPVSLLDADNGLAFVLHDLCHLEKFVDAAHYAGQVGFFARLDEVIDGPEWAALEEGLDGEWAAHRDHVLADMNGSPVFLQLVLRARLIDACVRRGIAPEERVRRLRALLDLTDDRAEMAARFSAAGALVLRNVHTRGDGSHSAAPTGA